MNPNDPVGWHYYDNLYCEDHVPGAIEVGCGEEGCLDPYCCPQPIHLDDDEWFQEAFGGKYLDCRLCFEISLESKQLRLDGLTRGVTRGTVRTIYDSTYCALNKLRRTL